MSTSYNDFSSLLLFYFINYYLLIVYFFQSIKFHNKHFPDGSRTKAKNFCRNPNDDIGGPWCYVEERSFELVEKEYCDVPFCDDRGVCSQITEKSKLRNCYKLKI